MSDARSDRLAEDMRDTRDRLGRVEIKLDAVLPHLATKAEVADVRTEMANVRTEISKAEVRLIRWTIGTGVVAVLVLSAQLWGAAQFLLRSGASPPVAKPAVFLVGDPPLPYSCRLLYDEQKKCALGS